MKAARSKNGWVLVLLMLAGVVIGGFVANLTKDSAALNWLSYGQAFGLDSPLVLNLGILVITFGLNIKITIASIIGMLLGGILYRFL